jgi:hypothetical protein
MSRLTVRGTIDFRHDIVNDIVIQTPRWTLDSPVEVMRWYQVQASYFAQRFREKKDVIILNGAFDVTPQVGTLWGQYRAKLHEVYVRHSVRVANSPRVRLTTNTSAARYSISALEALTLDEAVLAILAARAPAPARSPSGFRPASSSSSSLQKVSSSRPPPRANES